MVSRRPLADAGTIGQQALNAMASSALSRNSAVMLAPRGDIAVGAVLRRSRFVRGLKTGLIGAVAMLATANIAFAVHSSFTTTTPVEGLRTEDAEEMVNPRFTGRDSSGDPYMLTAESAVRDRNNLARIALDAPKLSFFTTEVPGSIVLADEGLYDRKADTLELQGNVRLETANGYRFATSIAQVLISEGRVIGVAAIEGEGPTGFLKAESFEIAEGGDRVAFRGRVRARLLQEPASTEYDIRDEPATGLGAADAFETRGEREATQ